SEQVVLILCGLIASGKSTFAQSLQDHFPRFKRCNQDDLGSRPQVEQLARQYLGQGYSVCIDRTNFNAPQRAYWIDIAREFPGVSIWVIVFDTPYEVCCARLRERTSHPTIKTPERGLEVLSRFAADFRPPAAHEGYDRIISIAPSDHTSPVYLHPEIAAILRRVRDSPPVPDARQNSASRSHVLADSAPRWRGRGFRVTHGAPTARGYGRGAPRGWFHQSRGSQTAWTDRRNQAGISDLHPRGQPRENEWRNMN
ncbi:P-loop containing nucleoside triphosphate hydrolase protein, partial [Infundibulicybe gibba]